MVTEVHSVLAAIASAVPATVTSFLPSPSIISGTGGVVVTVIRILGGL